jgi:succinyl-CoA synthetase alpha subunit
MAIFVDEHSRVLVQGVTGREGGFHTARMRSFGTNVVAGVSPGKGGSEIDGLPVYDTVLEAVAETSADVSVVFVPARFARDAMIEAADAGIRLIVCVTEGIPVRDMAECAAHLAAAGATLIGPNCPGIISPGRCSAGIMPADVFLAGHVGIVSRSGTLTYEVVHELTKAGIGQSTAVGMGGDPVHGVGFIECLERFEADPDTEAIVVIGEIGGDDEEHAARYVLENVWKPVVGYVAGFSAPPGKRMGHAGAIVEGASGTAAEKKAALQRAGIPVAATPPDLANIRATLFSRAATH